MFSVPSAYRGSTLIEVIGALFVVGVVLALFEIVLHVVPLGRLARDQDVALRIASYELTTLRGLGYDNLPVSGSFANADLADLASGTGALSVVDYNDTTKLVEVTVSWVEPPEATSYSVSLSSLITRVGGLP